MATTLRRQARSLGERIPVVAFGLLTGVLSGVLAMADQDANSGGQIQNDPLAALPNDPPAAPSSAALGASEPAQGNFSTKSAVHLRTAGTALVNWWRAV